MPLYENVVAAVRSAHGIGAADNDRFEAHLRTLVPALHELRGSYRSGWGSVAVTYSREVTEAYLLAYYPHYVDLTEVALGVLPPGALRNNQRMRVCAFACGPAPEPIAVARYLLRNGYGTGTLALALLDIVPELWEWARSVERILPRYWDRAVAFAGANAVDITAPNLMHGIQNIIERSDLVLFQNCLNEFPADQRNVEQNARALVATMKPGAVLLMADINNYPTGRASLDVFANVAQEVTEVFHDPTRILTVAPAPDRPTMLDRHFFLDGEYPRRRDFEFRCLAARMPER